jgi:vitamin B12 transporter
VARVFASYQASEKLLFKLRIENALNETYSEAVGYDALPRGVFTSVEWKF